ncbi:MAG: cupin domain-containing protein, partial [Aquisalinus sp.]|nr:cupin domain-containing protein [Aquisalinus sp.]
AQEVQIDQIEPGIKRQILGYNEHVMMVRVWFDSGAVGSMHTHHHSQVSYVESGVFEVAIGGDKKTLCKGDCFYVAPQVEHGAVCIEAGVLLDVFSPSREDFLA